MYPLHKYVPTPFGTYLMYINHGKERITVENFPEDMKTFKKELAYNSKKNRENKTFSSLPLEGTSKQDKALPSKKSLDIRPSYQIHFLQHTGQTITEPPPNIIVVDDITGADVTSTMSWIRNRPQRWKERLKLHKIENPKMTSTVKQHHLERATQPPLPDRSSHTEHIIFQERPMKQPGQKNVEKDVDKLRSSMLPHIRKPSYHHRGREKREERDGEARKRRRKVDKIMNIVSDRAKVAQVKSQNSPDKLFEIQETKTSKYLSGSANQQRSVSVEPFFTRKSKLHQEDPLRSSSELSHAQLKSRATISEEKRPPRIQDWNPREEHQLINRIVLERLEATLPYKWAQQDRRNSQGEEMAPQYHYVL